MTKSNKNSQKIRKLVMLSLLSAIIVLMSFTPLGYLKIGVVDITFLMIPVAIGGILLGPAGGAFLGGLFGMTSFIQCFGMSAFGVFLLGIDPLRTFVLCFIPRLLTGWVCGLIYHGLNRLLVRRTKDTDEQNSFSVQRGLTRLWVQSADGGTRTNPLPFAVASLSAALCNTVLFVGALILMFGGQNAVLEFFGVTSVMGIITAIITFNAVIEAAVTLVVGTAITTALAHSGITRHSPE